MNILITGGAGFIGLHLANKLVEINHKVMLLDNLSPQIHGAIPKVILPAGIELLRVDIRDKRNIQRVVNESDVIYHLVAETGTGQSMYDIQNYVDVNCIGTAVLLEAIMANSTKKRKIILSSSRSVYGEGAYALEGNEETVVSVPVRTREQLASEQWEPLDRNGRKVFPIATQESFAINTSSIYAATKASQEFIVSSASESINANPVILRFQNVYGEGQSLRNPYTGIISIFFNKARQRKEIPIYEDGFETRDFIHVDDVVVALIRSMEVNLDPGTVINVGSGKPTSVSELAETLLDVSGFAVPVVVTGQYRVGDIRHCYANIAKMNNLLDVSPIVSLEDGLRRFSNWAKNQEAYEDLSSVATDELKTRGLA